MKTEKEIKKKINLLIKDIKYSGENSSVAYFNKIIIKALMWVIEDNSLENTWEQKLSI